MVSFILHVKATRCPRVMGHGFPVMSPSGTGGSSNISKMITMRKPPAEINFDSLPCLYHLRKLSASFTKLGMCFSLRVKVLTIPLQKCNIWFRILGDFVYWEEILEEIDLCFWIRTRVSLYRLVLSALLHHSTATATGPDSEEGQRNLLTLHKAESSMMTPPVLRAIQRPRVSGI